MNLAAIFQVLEHLNDFLNNWLWQSLCFSKYGQNFSKAKHLKAKTFDGLSLYSEAIAPIIREK